LQKYKNLDEMEDLQFDCSYHPGGFLINDSRAGEIICSECGMVCGDRFLDVSVEWKSKQSSLNSHTLEDRRRIKRIRRILEEEKYAKTHNISYRCTF